MDNETRSAAEESTADVSEIVVTQIERKKKPKKSGVADFYEWVEMFALAMALVITVFSFFMKICSVDGQSMEKTLYDGEIVALRSFLYTPEAGDIVVLQSHSYGNKPIVKRIIAAGGQTLHIDFETWTVVVDGKPLKESYAYNYNGRNMEKADYFRIMEKYMDAGGTVTIPDGYCFVMGDNRNNSRDSRFAEIGLVEYQEIAGKVVFDISDFQRVD